MRAETPCVKGWLTGQSRISSCLRWGSKASRSLTMAILSYSWLIFGSDSYAIPNAIEFGKGDGAPREKGPRLRNGCAIMDKKPSSR